MPKIQSPVMAESVRYGLEVMGGTGTGYDRNPPDAFSVDAPVGKAIAVTPALETRMRGMPVSMARKRASL